MKWGFTIWELRGTDVLMLEHRAYLGLLLPLHVGLCHHGSLLQPGPAGVPVLAADWALMVTSYTLVMPWACPLA